MAPSTLPQLPGVITFSLDHDFFQLKENPLLTSCPFSSYCSISLLPFLAKPSEELPTPSLTISRKFSLEFIPVRPAPSPRFRVSRTGSPGASLPRPKAQFLVHVDVSPLSTAGHGKSLPPGTSFPKHHPFLSSHWLLLSLLCWFAHPPHPLSSPILGGEGVAGLSPQTSSVIIFGDHLQ